MKKIALSELFTANDYVAPPFSPEKKAQIFANTTRKKRSFLSVKKKYFVEITLSLMLVFVIGFNLDYIQDIGKPLEVNYQDIIDAELGVPSSEDQKTVVIIDEDVNGFVDSGSSSDSLAVFGDSVFYDVEETIEVILDVDKEDVNREDVTNPSKSPFIKGDSSVEIEKSNLWDKIFRKSSEPREEKLAYEIVPERYTEEVVYKPLSSDEDLPLTRENEEVAVEKIEIKEIKVVAEENIVSEVRDEKYFLNNEIKEEIEMIEEIEKIKMIEIVKVEEEPEPAKTQLLEIIANEVLPEPVKSVEVPVFESTKTIMLVDESMPSYLLEEDMHEEEDEEEDDYELSLSFIENQNIFVFENSAKLNFAVRVAGTMLAQSEDITIVCNIYVAGSFVDTFSYSHRVGYNVNKGATYRFADTLGYSYALHVLHSYNSDSFSPDVSGLKCGIPQYNIAAGWIDLAYDD